jgi:cytochrome b561
MIHWWTALLLVASVFVVAAWRAAGTTDRTGLREQVMGIGMNIPIAAAVLVVAHFVWHVPLP